MLETDYNGAFELFAKYATHNSGKMRRTAGEEVGKSGQESYSKIHNFLHSLLGNDIVNIRWTIAIAYGELGRINFQPIIADLKVLANDADWTVRESVSGALATIHEYHPEMLVSLENWTTDTKENVRRAVAESLGRGVGKKNPELAFPILKKLSGDESVYVRKAVADSCRNMSRRYSDMVIENLSEWNESADVNTRWTVADGLRYIARKKTSEAIPLLLSVAKDSRRYVQGCVISVLREAKKENMDTICDIMNQWLSYDDHNIQHIAKEVLKF